MWADRKFTHSILSGMYNFHAGRGGSMATACPKRKGLCTKLRGGGFNSLPLQVP